MGNSDRDGRRDKRSIITQCLGLVRATQPTQLLTPVSVCVQTAVARVTKCRRPIAYQLSDIYMTAVDGGFDLF
jgi:hypothetical protein